MGSNQSTVVRLPQMAKQHWKQIQNPFPNRYKPSHGKYKLLANTFTNEKIEQYSIIFQSQQECDDYIESFQWRERQDHLINTKYFEASTDSSLCGTRIYAQVCIEHTLYRLSNIVDIPIPQNLYILSSVLHGFQKLYELIGYFKPNQDLIGVDCEGRVKVWVNSNFSKNYLYGPHYVENNINLTGQNEGEEKLVRQTINLIEKNTFYQGSLPKFTNFISSSHSKINFASTFQLISLYSKSYNLIIPNYFVSLLRLFEQSQSSSQQNGRQVSLTSDPFRVSQSNIENPSNAVYYMNPCLKTNEKMDIMQVKSLTKMEQQLIQLQRENDTTGETMFKNSLKSHPHSTKYYSRQEPPKFKFQYIPQDKGQHFQNKQPIIPHMHLSKISENAMLQSVGITKRLSYSGVDEDYELDEELVEDLIKYFIK